MREWWERHRPPLKFTTSRSERPSVRRRGRPRIKSCCRTPSRAVGAIGRCLGRLVVGEKDFPALRLGVGCFGALDADQPAPLEFVRHALTMNRPRIRGTHRGTHAASLSGTSGRPDPLTMRKRHSPAG